MELASAGRYGIVLRMDVKAGEILGDEPFENKMKSLPPSSLCNVRVDQIGRLN
jgi:hypothetical protein